LRNAISAGGANRIRADNDEHPRETTDGFFAVDSDWKLTYINAEAEKMVRCKREDVLGHVLWEQFPWLIDRFSRPILNE